MPKPQTLLQLSKSLVSALEPDLLLQNITSNLAQAAQADKALMLISDDASSGQVRVAAAYEVTQIGAFPAEADWRIIDLAHCPVLVETMRSGRQHMIDQQCAPEQLPAMTKLLDCRSCSSILLQPLVHEGKGLGVLALMAGARREPFTPADSDFCQTWAEPAAQAIYNVRHYHEIKLQSAMVPFSVLESVAEGVLVSDVEGRVRLANAAAQEMLGAERDQLLGKSISAVLKQMPMFGSDLEELDAETEQQATFRLHDRILQSRMSAVTDDDSTFLGAVAILRDVTRIHEAERAKEKFVTTISHELRTPLTAMKGYIELLGGDMSEPLSAQQQGYVEVIQRNAERMVNLVNSLILVTQIQEGRAAPAHGHADLRQIIKQIIRENHSFAEENRVVLETEFADDVLVIQADPVQLYLAIERLVNNGIKYTRAGGSVTILARIQHDGDDEGGFAVVSVTDTGVGIPPEQQAHVFEQFYRLDERPIEVRAGGIGVGLSIVKTLVEAHGGRIWLESAVDQGSTFTFIVPAERRGSLPWLLKHTDDMLRRD